MRFSEKLIEGRLVKRYKRFLADVKLFDGSVITVHCPNPGSMLGLNVPGSRVWISDSRNKSRKLRYTLELIETNKTLVGINTNRPNLLAEEAINTGLITQLADYSTLRREVKYGNSSRIDILLQGNNIGNAPDIYVEVKNVTMIRTPGICEFPDSVTSRGRKHLHELMGMVRSGMRGVILFIIQREDGDKFKLASDIDPKYVQAFSEAVAFGVEAFAIKCHVTLDYIEVSSQVPITF